MNAMENIQRCFETEKNLTLNPKNDLTFVEWEVIHMLLQCLFEDVFLRGQNVPIF